MSDDILDLDLRDESAAYDAWVNRASEWVPAIQRWAVATQGSETNINWIHHILWRFLIERERWHTLRNAMEDREPGVGPTPVTPAPVHPVPQPSAPGRITRITGPFRPRMYSYWSNAVVLGGDTFLFAGGANGPEFFRIHDGVVTPLGQLIPYGGETEGWSWNADGSIYLCDGPRYRKVNPFTGRDEVVYDISQTRPGCVLRQPHSSESGVIHSATVTEADAPWSDLGTICVRAGSQHYYHAQGVLDESQVNERWLVIKESFHRQGEPADKLRLDNRIIDFHKGTDVWLRDEDGAFGHSDMGPDYIIGEDDQIGACKLRYLATGQERILMPTWNMGHVSVRAGRWLLSDATNLNISLLDGGVTILRHHGIDPGSDYDLQVRASLSPCGTRACWMERGDICVMELP